MGFPPETLRLTPTSGVAGKPVTFSIQGGDFYVGALHWLVSFGDANSGPVNQGGSCTLRGAFTPPKPGVYAVTVGYGAKGQALAGFYTASGGSGPPKWVQPGFPCGSGNTCASASPYSCSCKQGRCRCSK